MEHLPLGTCPLGKAVRITLSVEKQRCTHGVVLSYKRDGAAYNRVTMRWYGEKGDLDLYYATLNLAVGLYFYCFELNGVRLGADADLKVCEGGEDYHLTVYDKQYAAPDFLNGGLFYQIMVDRFACAEPRLCVDGTVAREDWGGIPTYKPDEKGIVRNNDFFGGNLAGVTEKLDYLASLHVTCIYLNPIFEARSNHKYDTADYTRIDPGFGTEEALKTLVSEAGKRGISVVLDGVFSHTGEDSVYFNRYGRYDSVGAYQSKKSPYYGWYDFARYPDEYACWWGIKLLPNVNENNPSYTEFITGEDGVIARWMRTGIAGWRLDVADELPDEFIAALTHAAKSVRPDALVLGEVWEDASDKISYSVRRQYFLGRELDSVTNYVFRSGILSYLTERNAKMLSRAVRRVVTYYPPDVVHALMNVIGTHDTPRMLTMLSGVNAFGLSKDERAQYVLTKEQRETAVKRLRLAAVLQYTLPGVPCLYYGDEAGMEGFEDPFNRRCYPWGKEDKALLAFYRKLGAIRASRKCFARGAYECLTDEEGVYVFRRLEGTDTVVVGINPNKRPYRLTLDGTYVDLMTGSPVTATEISPQDFVILGSIQ